MVNPLIAKKEISNVRIIELPKSKGILDDFAVRKNVATREGTIEKVPVNDNDIVNKAYVDALVSAICPVGVVFYIFSDTAPAGFVICAKQTIGISGATLNGSTYYNLYAHVWDLVNRGVIESWYLNAAKGASALADYNAGKFVYLPDSRGVFVRGAGTSTTLGNANGTAFAGSLGFHQNDKVQGHFHGVGIGQVGGTAIYYAVTVAGTGANYTESFGRATALLNDGTNGIPRIGLETNPANFCLTAIIKY